MQDLNRLIFLVPSNSVSSPKLRGFGICAVAVLLVPLLLFSPPSFAKEKFKHDKFTGLVVNAGPKAITVKSRENIYLLRTFSYTPQVEEKIKKKPPQPGKKVTVHYVRGSDIATKID
jgi:hypothetical protein